MPQVWVDPDSGTFGLSNLCIVQMTDDEIVVFGELSDSERISVAEYMADDSLTFDQAWCSTRGYHDSGDNPVTDGEAQCEQCGTFVNAVPDCGDPGPECVEHDGACD